MQRLEVSGAVRPLQGSLGVKGLKEFLLDFMHPFVLHNKLRYVNKGKKTQLYKNNKSTDHRFRPSRGHLQDIKKTYHGVRRLYCMLPGMFQISA